MASPIKLDNITEYLVLLVQEWLTVIQLPKTLQCLVDEVPRRGIAMPSQELWFEMTTMLNLESLSTSGTHGQHQCSSSLLCRIVEQILTNQQASRLKNQRQQQQPSLVMVTKRPLTAVKDPHKFSSKRTLPTPSSLAKSTGQLPASTPMSSPKSILRPKSAVICKSTTDLITRTTPGIRNGPILTSVKAPATISNQQDSLRSRPISANGALTPHRDRKASLNSLNKPASQNIIKEAVSAITISPQSLSRSPSKLIMTASSRNLENLASTRSSTTQLSIPEENTGRRSEDEQNEDVMVCVEPSMELEDMSEERLAENYASLSKGAIKKLRRVLARSSAHSQEIQRCRKAMDKIHSRAKQQDERAVFASEHTELLSSTMDMLTKEPCSLCRYVFLKKNLTTRVSYKSICDLRASWRAKTHVGKHDAGETGPETSPSHGNNSHWNDWDDPRRDHMQDLDPINQVLDVSQISHLYDEVPVCVFCAQLLLDYPSYRPSSAQQRQQKEAKHLAALERRKLRDEQRELDKQRCDPLDFDPSALNSDEDNSDTDEFLVYKPDGRVDVVRHRRHRSTLRVPAQLGFVSKRLHYDHLRTQSIRVLNRKEWDLIVRSHSTKQV